MKKCDYCGKEISYSEQYCSTECENHAVAFYRHESKFKNIFGFVNAVCIVGVLLGCFAGLIVSPFVGGLMVSAGLIILGILVISVPLAPLDGIKKLKIKKAVLFTRCLGALLVFLGVVVLLVFVI